jgi:hypothetical protein
MAPPRRVRCPICMDPIDLSPDDYVWLYEEGEQDPKPSWISHLDPLRQHDMRQQGYLPCPNPSGDTAIHYLPALYGSYGDPLVIGLIGTPGSGKTHFLTAMITAALAGLGVLGMAVSSMDSRRHELFRDRNIRPFERGIALGSTGTDVVDYADILLVHGTGGTRPVTFFDIAGENQVQASAGGRASRFLVGVGGLIFVHASDDSLDTGMSGTALNAAFGPAIARVRSVPGATKLPATIALAKSDRLRYVPPADRWMRRPTESVLDAQRMREESRDVYAYLWSKGATSSLAPFEIFERCTLHFVSSSGGDAVLRKGADPKSPDAYEFPRGVRPARVLEPLVAILAMAGVIDGPEARKVGRP